MTCPDCNQRPAIAENIDSVRRCYQCAINRAGWRYRYGDRDRDKRRATQMRLQEREEN